MIIQALVQHYENLTSAAAERLRAGDAGESGGEAGPQLAPFGYSVQKIAFVVVLNKDGSLFAIQDAREEVPVVPPKGATKERPSKSRKMAKRLIVPAVPGRTVAVLPWFLCDTPAYMLGFAGAAKASKPERVRTCFEAFRDGHAQAKREINDRGFDAVCAFLERWKPSDLKTRPAAERALLEEVAAGGFGVFQLLAQDEFVHERPAVRAYWDAQQELALDASDAPPGGLGEMGPIVAPSLLTGRDEPLARLHEPAIKGVVGAETSGAKVASFNCDAFESYGKRQTYNAPLGVRDAFRYCTALNQLLADPRHRVRLGATTVVFWTANPSLARAGTAEPPGAAVDFFAACVRGLGSQDAVLLEKLEHVLNRSRQGQWSDLGDPATEFFIIGLSPNASRLAVRFWIKSTVGAVFGHLRNHMDGLSLGGAPDRFTPPTLQQIARETLMAKNGWPDEDRLPPQLVEQLARSVLLGLPYPPSLLGAVVQRARTDGWVNSAARLESDRVIAHRRACIIAACLRRQSTPVEIPMSLDESLTDRAYRLGRLFAVLDTLAEDTSNRKVNRRDKYFASASANPSSVFPRLMRLSTFDLRKIGAESPGWRVARERLIQEICDGIDPQNPFPPFLALAEQGRFCIGYHQQRQHLFTRKDTTPQAADAAASA